MFVKLRVWYNHHHRHILEAPVYLRERENPKSPTFSSLSLSLCSTATILFLHAMLYVNMATTPPTIVTYKKPLKSHIDRPTTTIAFCIIVCVLCMPYIVCDYGSIICVGVTITTTTPTTTIVT